MTERDHNGEPILTKELPLQVFELRNALRNTKDIKARSDVYRDGLNLREGQRQHVIQCFELFREDLDSVITESLKSVNAVTDFTPQQKIRVHEAITNAVIVTAETVHEHLDEDLYKASYHTAIDDFFYTAVESVEGHHRELVDKLWSEISN